MKFRAFAAALAFALLAALPASSQNAGGATTTPPANVYHIEIIIFRATQSLGGAENWSAQASRTIEGTDGGEVASTRNVGRFVAALPATSHQLTPLAAKLRSTGLYQPIAHVAWSQTASDWGTRAGFQLSRLGVDVPGLSGTVFLERGQYLHLGMALSYAPANAPAGMGAGPGTTFNISQTRRIRFYERNYYDHPGFGVIALVTPAQGSRPAGR
jgi:hypothetical protein